MQTRSDTPVLWLHSNKSDHAPFQEGVHVLRANPSFWPAENLPHLLHEFRGIVNLKSARRTMFQIDDQILSPAYGAGKDESLDHSRAQEVAEFHRRGDIAWGEAALPDGQERLGQSPL